VANIFDLTSLERTISKIWKIIKRSCTTRVSIYVPVYMHNGFSYLVSKPASVIRGFSIRTRGYAEMLENVNQKI
jgi:hypothetical protein